MGNLIFPENVEAFKIIFIWYQATCTTLFVVETYKVKKGNSSVVNIRYLYIADKLR